jgi:hypothetical protein
MNMNIGLCLSLDHGDGIPASLLHCRLQGRVQRLVAFGCHDGQTMHNPMAGHVAAALLTVTPSSGRCFGLLCLSWRRFWEIDSAHGTQANVGIPSLRHERGWLYKKDRTPVVCT